MVWIQSSQGRLTAPSKGSAGVKEVAETAVGAEQASTSRKPDGPVVQSAASVTPGPVAEQADRIVVDIKPADLLEFLKDRTSVEAGRLLAPYIGRWMRVTGTVHDVRRSEQWVVVSVDIPEEMMKVVMLYFRGRRNWDRVETLRKGREMTAVGEGVSSGLTTRVWRSKSASSRHQLCPRPEDGDGHWVCRPDRPQSWSSGPDRDPGVGHVQQVRGGGGDDRIRTGE